MRKFPSTRAVAFALSFLAFTAGKSEASCLQPHPVRVCTEFYHSDHVLVARVVSKRKIPVSPEPDNIEGWFYKLKTVTTYRGGPLPNDEVYSGNDDSNFPMEAGQIYLIFMNNNLEGRPVADVCGNSAPADTAGNAVTAIETILKAAATKSGGSIGGQVLRAVPGTEAVSENGVAGATMTVRDGNGKEQTARTDKDGRFDIHVVAGHYSVTGADASNIYDIKPFALGYMSPKDIEIADGGCADLIFSDGFN